MAVINALISIVTDVFFSAWHGIFYNQKGSKTRKNAAKMDCGKVIFEDN